jgi:hypothetical protein
MPSNNSNDDFRRNWPDDDSFGQGEFGNAQTGEQQESKAGDAQ